MSITIRRTVPIINGCIQYAPNLEAAKNAHPTDESDLENIIELSHNPLLSNTFLVYEEEVVQA